MELAELDVSLKGIAGTFGNILKLPTTSSITKTLLRKKIVAQKEDKIKPIDIHDLKPFIEEEKGIKVAIIGTHDHDAQAISHALLSHLVAKQALSDVIILDDSNDLVSKMNKELPEPTHPNYLRPYSPIATHFEPKKSKKRTGNKKYVKRKKAKNGRNKKKK